MIWKEERGSGVERRRWMYLGVLKVFDGEGGWYLMRWLNRFVVEVEDDGKGVLKSEFDWLSNVRYKYWGEEMWWM